MGTAPTSRCDPAISGVRSPTRTTPLCSRISGCRERPTFFDPRAAAVRPWSRATPARFRIAVDWRPEVLCRSETVPTRPNSRAAFTLIELLVVIAIVALLISILLPAIGRARKAGYMAVSLSNLKQINTSATSYKLDNKGMMPLIMPMPPRQIPPPPDAPINQVCTWTFGGKNTSRAWFGGVFDVMAADRPLNPYVYPEITWDCPPRESGQVLPADAPARTLQQAEAFRDPSDKVDHQINWPNANPSTTAYDAVGTSYQSNIKWWDRIRLDANFTQQPKWRRAFEFGMRRMNAADSYSPSRFVWFHDEYADIVIYSNSPKAMVRNGYGDINKSLLGFLDGHVAYLTVFPGNVEIAFNNGDYQMTFDGLKFK
ncbi:MAG: type II secretion system protein [Phycisphaerae bacterium]|nr:type II secretion system protein [Phycisphaerae bacterium]